MFIILYMVAKRKLAKKVDSLTHEWNITLYSDDLKETISEELKKIQARVHLDGFRNGHAPIDVVEKHYGEDALYRAVNSEIRKTIDEIVKDSEISNLVKSENSDLMKVRQAHASLMHGIDLLNRYVPKKSPLLSAKPEVTPDEFLDETGLWGAVQFAQQIEEEDGRIKRIAAEESRQRSVIESLKPWSDLTMPLNSEGTEYAAVLLGTIPARIPLEEVASAVEKVTEEAQLYSVSEDKSQHYVMLICLREKLGLYVHLDVFHLFDALWRFFRSRSCKVRPISSSLAI